VGYGSAGERKKAAAKMKRATVMAEAAPEAAASRAAYRGVSGSVGTRDLLADEKAGKVSLDKLKDSEMPDELRGKTKAQRKAYLAKKRAERKKIQAQITEISKKRDAYIREQMSKTKGSGDSFDAKVIDSIRAKAAKKGISY